MQYLSSEQALADAAHFIEAMSTKRQLPEGTKWIVFGGSYAGNLVTWLRDKYPDVVYGAVASSAPLLAKLNFPGILRWTLTVVYRSKISTSTIYGQSRRSFCVFSIHCN